MRIILTYFIFILSIQFGYTQCDYILTINDSYGDGWIDDNWESNGYVEINNDGSISSITLEQFESTKTETITVSDGETLIVTYHSVCGTGSGCDEDENSFELKDCNDHVLWSGVGGTNSSKTFTVDCSCTGLPVVYTSMSYDYIAKELTWQTLSEINNDYFLIEIGTNFNAKGDLIVEETYFVNGNGNANTINYYSYSIKAEHKYVKLSQVDYDNTVKVLDLKYFSKKQSFNDNTIKIYPNPAIANSLININGEYTTIEIYNLLGEKINAIINNNQILGLDKGIYLIRIDNNSIKLIVK